MNKIIKISLLLSTVIISLFNAPTQCMEVRPEKDNLQLALEHIDQLPDDLNQLTIADRQLLIVTEMNNDVTKAESNFYIREIVKRLAKKYNKEVSKLNSKTVHTGNIEFEFDPITKHFLKENIKTFIRNFLEKNKEKIIAVNFNDLNLDYQQTVMLAHFVGSIPDYDKLFIISNINRGIDANFFIPNVPQQMKELIKLKWESLSSLDRSGLHRQETETGLFVNTDHYHRSLPETVDENERIQFMQENIAQKTIIELNDGTKRLIIPRFCLQ